MKRGLWLGLIGSLFLTITLIGRWWFTTETHSFQEARTMQERLTAPDFPQGLEWLNTERPLSLRDLRGKIVLLDFWTYCCINCMHILPDLKRLEKKYARELVVIGVHSAKFFTEQEAQNIRQAILRYEIEHPVVNDHQMAIWDLYGVHAWPTLVLIDPQGKIVYRRSGEGVYEPFDHLIGQLITEFDRRGLLDRTPLKFKLERERKPATPLNFPGKVLADEVTDRLFIADSNHHRIVVLSLKDYTVQMVIGNGQPGLRDGDFHAASFRNPQGMAFDPSQELLYIADTDNHAIRRADLRSRKVETLAGTGEQNRLYPPPSGAGKQTALNSPWDVVLMGETLYIAMAGSHQLWRLDLRTGLVEPHAGTGREALIDAPHRAAALAQPSGITTDGKRLYFADSEVSSIRAADIDPNGRVETLVGGDLFVFGDRDGIGREARLQHPLGVVYYQGMLYVTDTYNNKIKRLDPRTRRIETLFGTGEEGARDGENPTFDEPGGITAAHGKLYIADTNNHLIRIADLKTRRVETLVIRGLDKLNPPPHAMRTEQITLPEAAAAEQSQLRLIIQLPEGYKLNPNAPSRLTLKAKGATIEGQTELTCSLNTLSLELPLKLTAPSAMLKAHLWLYYCQSGREALCFIKEAELTQPLRRTETTHSVQIEYRVQP